MSWVLSLIGGAGWTGTFYSVAVSIDTVTDLYHVFSMIYQIDYK